MTATWVWDVPDSLDNWAAAALAASFLTADVALVAVGRRAAETVVVHTAAGGLGGTVAHLCRVYGPRKVVATAGRETKRASPAASAPTRSAATTSSSTSRESHGKQARTCRSNPSEDYVPARSVRCLAPLGRIASIGASSGDAPARLRLPHLWVGSRTVARPHCGTLLQQAPTEGAPSWEGIPEAFADGRVAPSVTAVFAADDAVHSSEIPAARQVAGGIVIAVPDVTSP